MILHAEAVMVLVLELLNDVHKVDVGLFDVEVKWIHFLESMDSLQVQVVHLRDTQLVHGKVDVADARVSLESCFIFADP